MKSLCKWWLTNKRSYSWGEDGATLNNEGHPCSNQNCEVASKPAEGEGEVWNQTDRQEVSNKPDTVSKVWLHTLGPYDRNKQRFSSKQYLCLCFLCPTTGPVDLETSQKQQGGSTWVAHQAPSQRQMCWLSNRLQRTWRREVLLLFFTCVEHLLDDQRHLSFQHRVEQLDNEDEACA